ncbi:MAG: DMT family transporter [Verrucomicrobiales bacterium]|nr:DMT family transporter [Verrucomicrobiales bacterium]
MEPKNLSAEKRGVFLMLVSVVFFAANVLVLRAVSLRVPEADGYAASVFRGWVGLLVVVVVYRGRGFEPWRLVQRPLLLARGLVGAAGILLFYVTIEHLGAGRAVILNLTYPIFGAGMAAVWLREGVTARALVWMGVALVGLGVFFADGLAAGTGVTRYEVLALLGALVAGAAVVLIRLLSRTEHAATIYASQCVWSFLVALPLAGGAVWSLPLWVMGTLVAASLLVTVGQLALTRAFRDLSVAKGSSIQMLLPLATGLGGVAFFGERYVWTELAGALVTLGATWAVVRERGGPPRAVGATAARPASS